jgi:hypothetical protein
MLAATTAFSLPQAHRALFSSLILYFGILTLWGLFEWVRGRNPSSSYLGALILGEGLGAIQDLVGLILMATGKHPADPLHFLYGAVIILTLPTVYGIVDQARTRRSTLFFALACAFLIGIAIRASATGS